MTNIIMFVADTSLTEMTKYGAEELYLERAVTALEGTAGECAEKPELPPLDRAGGDRDTGAHLSSREDEAETELLDSNPCHGTRSGKRSGALCGLVCPGLHDSPFVHCIATCGTFPRAVLSRRSEPRMLHNKSSLLQSHIAVTRVRSRANCVRLRRTAHPDHMSSTAPLASTCSK